MIWKYVAGGIHLWSNLGSYYGARVFPPPGRFHSCVTPRLFPRKFPPRAFHPWGDTSPPRFARVRIGDSSQNRFASTAYFVQSLLTKRCFHAYFSWGECSGEETTGVKLSGGGGILWSPKNQHNIIIELLLPVDWQTNLTRLMNYSYLCL